MQGAYIFILCIHALFRNPSYPSGISLPRLTLFPCHAKYLNPTNLHNNSRLSFLRICVEPQRFQHEQRSSSCSSFRIQHICLACYAESREVSCSNCWSNLCVQGVMRSQQVFRFALCILGARCFIFLSASLRNQVDQQTGAKSTNAIARA